MIELELLENDLADNRAAPVRTVAEARALLADVERLIGRRRR